MAPLPLYSYSTWPDGGLRSSANDLAKYLLMVMNKGKIDNTRILTVNSVKEMLPTADRYSEIGVFWYKEKLTNGRTVIGHGGVEAGAYTYMFYDPNKQVGVILLANGDDDHIFHSRGVDPVAWNERHNTLLNKLLNYANDSGK